jgi:ACT domain-containing protein
MQDESISPKKTLESPQKASIYFTKDNCGYDLVINSLQKAAEGDSIHIDSFVFTDKKLAALLAQKAQEKVTISLNICQSHGNEQTEKEIIDSLRKAGVLVTIINEHQKRMTGWLPQNLHQKSILWTFQKKVHSPTKKHEFRSWSGSRNFSHLAMRNQETMIYEPIDEQTFKKRKTEHMTMQVLDGIENSPSKKQIMYAHNPVLHATPTKPETYPSYKIDLCTSIAERIKNTDSSGSLYINCPIIDHPQTQAMIEQQAQAGALKILNVDQEMLKKEPNVRWLKKIAHCNVSVNVFNADHAYTFGRYLTQNHMKAIARIKSDGTPLVMITSANLTTKSNNDINNLTLYPNDHEMANNLIAEMQSIAKKSLPLDKALEEYQKNNTTQPADVQLQAVNTLKRKLNFNKII